MELRVLFAPLYAAALGGLVLAALAWRANSSPRWPITLSGAAVVALAWMAASPAGGQEGWPSMRPVLTVFGLALLAAAAVLAVVGTRLRRMSELIVSSAPRPLDEAIGAARAGRGRPLGVFEGRLAASEPVASPGGVLGAFFDAEVRSRGAHGERGPLVLREQASSQVVYLRGDRTQASIELAPKSVLGPVSVRQCRAGSPPELPMQGALADGSPPVDALSFERVGKLGGHCLVAGRLEPGPVAGSYRLRGEGGSPVLIVLDDTGVPFGRALGWKARASFAAAAALMAASAACLAGL